MLHDRIISMRGAAELQRWSHSGGDLLVWTICHNTLDYPGMFSARPHSSRKNQPLLVVLVYDTLEEVRAALPPGLYRQNRSPSDDAVILEAWF